jgi:4-hydroxybenzoate polyprenyltransferase
MKTIAAFFRLIRWPNLVFIVLTQVLFYYCFVETLHKKGINTQGGLKSYSLIILLSILIAAAGNIINDYFDLNIDLVNKPNKLVIDKTIKRRWAIIWHLVLSTVGIFIGFYLDYLSHTYWIGLSTLICVLLLFGYSASLKKKFLIGNVLISALTAWVIIIVFLWYNNTFYCSDCNRNEIDGLLRNFIKYSILYGSFSFIISLIREVIKDMEDIEGDAKYGCKTMPIVWGIQASKVFVGVWIVVLIAALTILQFYVMQFNWWLSIAYCVLFIITPLSITLQKLYKAQVTKEYHQLSTLVKFVMLTGILSMIFFRIYS